MRGPLVATSKPQFPLLSAPRSSSGNSSSSNSTNKRPLTIETKWLTTVKTQSIAAPSYTLGNSTTAAAAVGTGGMSGGSYVGTQGSFFRGVSEPLLNLEIFDDQQAIMPDPLMTFSPCIPGFAAPASSSSTAQQHQPQHQQNNNAHGSIFGLGLSRSSMPQQQQQAQHNRVQQYQHQQQQQYQQQQQQQQLAYPPQIAALASGRYTSDRYITDSAASPAGGSFPLSEGFSTAAAGTGQHSEVTWQ
eukprot:6095-Heterococcus_DN1.PRE.1